MGPSRRPAASPAVAELALLLLTLSLSGSVLACKGSHHHHDEFESVRSLDRKRLEPVASIGETEVIASPNTASLLEEAPFQRREASREDTREESREGVDPRPGKMDMLFLAAMVDARAPGGEEVAGTVNIIRQSPRRDPAGVQQVSRTPSSVQERTRLEEQAKSSSQSDSQTQVSPEAGLEADSPQRPERPSVLELDVRGGVERAASRPDLLCADSAQCARIADMIKRDMNPLADPCYNADEYFCGGWRARTPVPADESSWTLAFDTLARDTREYLKSTLEAKSCADMRGELRRQQTSQAERKAPESQSVSSEDSRSSASTEEKKERTLDEWDVLATCIYEACMDEEAIDTRGATPLTDLMFGESDSRTMSLEFLLNGDFSQEAKELAEKEGSAVQSSPSSAPTSYRRRVAVIVQRLQAIFHRLKDVLFWSAYVGPNELHPDQGQTLNLGSLKLGLSYHFYEDDHLDYQMYYREHISNLLKIFETHVARTHPDLMDSAQQRNPNMRRSHTERARRIFEFEKGSLRPLVLSPEELRKVKEYTHEITYGELKATTKVLDVEALLHMYLDMIPRLESENDEGPVSSSSLEGKITFTASGVHVDDRVVLLIHEKDYFSKLEAMFQSVDWDVLHDYLLYKVVRSDASLLAKDFRDELQRYSKQVTKADPLPRWRTCVSSVPQWILSRNYVLGRFDKEKKQTVQHMAAGIRKAFRSLLEEYAWMDSATRQEALSKLAGMEEKIGFPDWLLEDYETYFTRYYGDKHQALAHANVHFDIQWHLGLEAIRSQLSEFGQPVDRKEWAMKPHSVNAYFSPSQNEIAFMAAVLQEPSLFVASPGASRGEETVVKALSYGAIAGVIAHEVTHGFDDVGKEYDVQGRLRNWWTADSERAFKDEAACMRDQYSAYHVVVAVDSDASAEGTAEEVTRLGASLEGEGEATQTAKRTKTVRVRGDLTLGENIADNGGVQLAWKALKLELSAEQLNSRPLESYGVPMTAAQLFMFSWGHFWCEVALDSFIRRQVETDPHSPARFRIQGPLANFALFAEAEQCPAGSPLNPEKKCRVW